MRLFRGVAAQLAQQRGEGELLDEREHPPGERTGAGEVDHRGDDERGDPGSAVAEHEHHRGGNQAHPGRDDEHRGHQHRAEQPGEADGGAARVEDRELGVVGDQAPRLTEEPADHLAQAWSARGALRLANRCFHASRASASAC